MIDNDSLEKITQEYCDFCKAEGLPDLSMEEQVCEDLTPAQKAHISSLIERWEAAEIAEAQEEDAFVEAAWEELTDQAKRVLDKDSFLSGFRLGLSAAYIDPNNGGE